MSGVASKFRSQRLLKGGMAIALLVGITTPIALALGTTSSGAATPSFTPGDLVVEVDQQTTTGNIVDPVDLVDYTTSGSTPRFLGCFAHNDPGEQPSSRRLWRLRERRFANRLGGRREPRSRRVRTEHGHRHRLDRPGTDHASPDVVGIVGSTGVVDTTTQINDGTSGLEYTHYDRSATIATSGLSPSNTSVYVSGSQMLDETTTAPTRRPTTPPLPTSLRPAGLRRQPLRVGLFRGHLRGRYGPAHFGGH